MLSVPVEQFPALQGRAYAHRAAIDALKYAPQIFDNSKKVE